MRKTITLITFFTFFSCGGSGIEGYVNEPINITAKNPDEELDVDYYWTLADQPDGSLMNTNDLIPNTDGQSMDFTPDYPGDYSIEVIISQYGDEISSQVFSFLILDPTERSDEQDIDESVDEDWLNEEIVEEDIDDVIAKEDIDDVITEEDIDDVITEEDIDDVITEEDVKYIPPAAEVSSRGFLNGKKSSSIAERVDRFTIQITSKRMLKDAQLFSQKMISKGYDSYIQKADFKTDQIWYRVRVGSYDNYNSAKAAADALSGELGMKTWVDFVRKEQ